MFVAGLPVKPLIYVERVHIPLEQQYKFLSDESTTDSDEEWTLDSKKKKKKKNKDEPIDPGNYLQYRCNRKVYLIIKVQHNEEFLLMHNNTSIHGLDF